MYESLVPYNLNRLEDLKNLKGLKIVNLVKNMRSSLRCNVVKHPLGSTRCLISLYIQYIVSFPVYFIFCKRYKDAYMIMFIMNTTCPYVRQFAVPKKSTKPKGQDYVYMLFSGLLNPCVDARVFRPSFV